MTKLLDSALVLCDLDHLLVVGQGRLTGGKAQLHRGICRNDALPGLTDQLEHLAAPGGDGELVSRAVDGQADRTQHCFRRDGTRCQTMPPCCARSAPVWMS